MRKTAKLSNLALAVPAPGAITAALVSDVCGARVYRYTATAVSATATAAGASGYDWSLPSFGGASIDSGDVTSSRVIKVKYTSNAAAAATDFINVRSVSGCGFSAYKGLKLTNTAKTGCAASRDAIAEPSIVSSAATTATVYPNPNNGQFTISIQTATKADYAKIQLLGIYGNVILEVRAAVNGDGSIVAPISANSLSAGIYTAKYIVGNETGNVRVVIVK